MARNDAELVHAAPAAAPKLYLFIWRSGSTSSGSLWPGSASNIGGTAKTEPRKASSGYGHSALLVEGSGGDSNMYLSFYPQGRNMFGGPGVFHLATMDLYERAHIIELPIRDRYGAVRASLADISEEAMNLNYNLLTNNCSSIVRRVLRAAGYALAPTILDTPTGLIIATQAVEDSRVIERTTAAGEGAVTPEYSRLTRLLDDYGTPDGGGRRTEPGAEFPRNIVPPTLVARSIPPSVLAAPEVAPADHAAELDATSEHARLLPETHAGGVGGVRQRPTIAALTGAEVARVDLAAGVAGDREKEKSDGDGEHLGV